MEIVKKYLSNMERLALKNARNMTDALEDALVEAMTSLNIGMISFAMNGDNSNFDAPRAYATIADDKYMTGNDYSVKEIVAVLVKKGAIYIVPDTPKITDELLSELENWTHFIPRDVAKLKDLESVAMSLNYNYNFINWNDTMLKLFIACNDAIKPLRNPLHKTITIL